MSLHRRGLFDGRPALASLAFYVIGILAGCYSPLLPTVFLALSIALVVVAIVFHFRLSSKVSTSAIFVALIFVGISQYQFAVSGFPPTHIKNIAENGGTVSILGRVDSEPDIRSDKTYLTIDVDSVTWRGRQIKSSGKIIVKIKQATTFVSYDDLIRFKGYLFAPGGARNPGSFDYARWLSYREVFGMMVLDTPEPIVRLGKTSSGVRGFSLSRLFINKVVAPLRRILLDGYDRYLPSDQASLLAGFVLGEKRAMPDNIVRLFSDTGTLHLMAVSGSNVAVVAGFFLVILSRINRRTRIIITLVVIVLFSFLTRNEPSVVRASVMASVGLIGFYRQKHPDVLGLLGFAGLILLIFRPLWLFNVGFQLSFAACGGIIYLMPKFLNAIKRGSSALSKVLYWLLFTLLTTLAAQIAVLPLTAEYFNRLPLIGILANLPMIILAGILTIAGLCFLPFQLIGGPVASVFAWPLSQLMSVIVPLLKFFVNLPYAVINIGSPGVLKITIFFCLLYIAAEFIFIKRLSFKALGLSLATLIAALTLSYLQMPAGESLNFIDCGSDRAVIYTNASGNRFLWYDCHEYGSCKQLDSNLLPYLRKQGITRIDTIFTNNKAIMCNLQQEITIGKVLHHNEVGQNMVFSVKENSPYKIAESILNKEVKFVGIETDNNIETLTEGHYYKVSTCGGECILAGQMPSRMIDAIDYTASFIELPWSCQAYGSVYKHLVENPPSLLIFSPDRESPTMVKHKNNLTYLVDRTLATGICGGFRLRFGTDRTCVDYMIEP